MEQEQTPETGTGPMGMEREDPKPTGGNGAKAPPPPAIRYAGESPSLKDLRAALTADVRKVIQRATQHFESELIQAWDELTAGVRTSSAEGSFSTTLQIRRAKKRFKGTMSCRVRTPREPLDFDLHLDDDGQLALGLGPDDEEE